MRHAHESLTAYTSPDDTISQSTTAALTTNNLHNIKLLVDSDRIWEHYQVLPSTPDGHCILHSVVSSYNVQMSPRDDITLQGLLTAIDFECHVHFDIYKPLISDSRETFLMNMNRYITNRIFYSNFCD